MQREPEPDSAAGTAGADAGPSGVTATGPGGWPGTDPAEAARIIRGELGDPHLPFLVELPQRGIGADPVGRTAGLLVELPVDLQPHGWRLVDRPGIDQRRAVSLLSRDINALADVIGEEEDPGRSLAVSLQGPLSLAAGLHLHNGERALTDAGARREIAESLAAGAAGFVHRVKEVARGASIVVQLDEPHLDKVLGGRIPTASGYRTLRSVPAQEASLMWTMVRESLTAAGASDVILRLPSAGHGQAKSGLDLALGSGAHGVALPLRGLRDRDWEGIAEAVEAGKQVWLGVLPLPAGGEEPRQVTALVEDITRPWTRVGLPLRDLPALHITPDGALSDLAPGPARRVLARLTQTASALDQLAAEG
ncbi:hypothetical protein H9638_10225 [Arthrobacter sp. Sa2BUA2]|uniref:Cobalamin-independent methionine synthase MetE C-terminal/archaeal domain-containing protein n=1 Tax=Arthrobacter pullicola TaxID=2762224 RepID=A0ABR8YIX9_9MICC|nr:hypothetical protein [Arthrobacter pullicola]MBD8044181.1 hypothetical protein [Arthrobacter pullicola]